ncbi:MAG: B12-binding domain-containing radical SAM protein [Deltaproteobacteria bacterium]|nr:B12-binding domain-containing radical SAM protein [Deltaproteobacteria bacterium]
MADILLIQPPIRDYYLTKKRTIPYGLMSLASGLMEKGFSVDLLDALATPKSKIIDIPSEMDYLSTYYGRTDTSPFSLFHHYRHYGYSFQHIGKIVRESNAFLVGIASLFTPYADMSIQTAQTVKKFLPDCTVVIGGHHPTELPHDVLESGAVDYLIRGEGEVALPLLADALHNGTSLENIPGLCFRKRDGTFRIVEPAMMKNIDDYPLPAAQLLNSKYYMRGDHAGYTITASRGCPFKCSYCAMGRSPLGIYRRRNVDRIITEMKTAVHTYNCGFFDFEDENLTHDKKWFTALMTKIVLAFKDRDIELRAMNGLFPPSIDQDLLPLMKQAGFKTLNLSLGTTSGSQLKKFNRPDVRPAFERLTETAEMYRLACVGYIIVGAPFQDPGQSVDDLIYLWRSRVLAGVSVYYPAPGSADYAICQKLNLLPEFSSLFRSSALPLDHTTNRLETVTLLRLGRIVNFIKRLADLRIPIPKPAACSRAYFSASTDRLEIGSTLLKWFLKDGIIRGVDARGHVYTHATAAALIEKFMNGLGL